MSTFQEVHRFRQYQHSRSGETVRIGNITIGSREESSIHFSDAEGLNGTDDGGLTGSTEESSIQFSDAEGLNGQNGTDGVILNAILSDNGSGTSHPVGEHVRIEGLPRSDTDDEDSCIQFANADGLDGPDHEGSYDSITMADTSVADIHQKTDGQDEDIFKILGSHCCANDCIATISRREVAEAKNHFANKTLYEQRCWILQSLHTHSRRTSSGHHQFAYAVGTAWVCMEAWRLVHGIGKKRLWAMHRLCRRGATVPTPPNSHHKGRRKASVHSAVVWLRDFASKCGDRMPDSQRIHLPACHSRNSVYNMMKAELSELNIPICSMSYFLRLWREELPHICIPSVNRFAKCDTCTAIKTKLQNCSHPKQRIHLNKAREQHLQQQRTEREKYYKHQRKAKTRPSKYLSLIIDGMDQKSTSLPHFVQESKSTNGAWKLNTHVTGGIVHGRGQHAFIDLNEYSHDPNLTVTVLMEMLRKHTSNLPKVLYLQLDNCGRENKNRHVFAFLCLLVELDIFTKVKVSFLMVGHTHDDIDQFFSRISTRLHRTNIPTVQGLIDIIPKSFSKGVTTAERLESVFNVKEWLMPCMEDISQHSRPHVFKITKDEDGRATIQTKMWSSSPEWVSPSGSPHLLTRHPDGAPSVVPPNFQKVDLPRLEQHIEKMQPFMTAEAMDSWRSTLNQLHKEDSGDADITPSWPLVDLLLPGHGKELCLQISMSSSSYESEVEEEQPCQVIIGRKKKARSGVPSEGDMVAAFLVQYSPEWPQVGKVIGKREGELQVHWYTGTITSQWKPLTIPAPGKRGTRQEWMEWIPVDAIICAPFKLTRTLRLSSESQAELKELRDHYIA